MDTTPLTLALFGNFGWQEIALLAVLGVLIFGRRLPEVGRSVGKGIVEFKKGLAGIDDDIEQQVNRPVSEKGKIEKSDAANDVSTETSQKTSQES